MNASRTPRRLSELVPATATSTPDWSRCQKLLGSLIMISSRQNQRLKDIRRLRRSKGDHALLEGPHLVADALAAGLRLEEILATPAFLASAEGRRLARMPGDWPVEPLEVDPELLAELTDADSPRGVLAVAHLPRAGAAALPVDVPPRGRPYLHLDGLQDPGNPAALRRPPQPAAPPR